MHDTATAPAGWGFKPGHVLAGGAELLPDMPMLPFVRNKKAAIVEVISRVPGLAYHLQPRDLVRKYGLPQASASDTLKAAREAA